MSNYIHEPQAKVLADSVSPAGHRLTTLEVTMHRYVLAEFNTHRVFSRNSASSRAIPGHVQRQRVTDTPALPTEWPQKLAGMQGGEPLPDDMHELLASTWRLAGNTAAHYAAVLDQAGVHKSVTNRLLEPFLYQTVIVSATDWDGFWEQRCSPLAQPEIRVAAEAMQAAYDESTPREIGNMVWHMPLVDYKDRSVLYNKLVHEHYRGNINDELARLLRHVSAARCARVSYLTHDGTRSIEKDLALYDRLISADPPHWSPLEHVATPCACNEYVAVRNREQRIVTPDHQGNFTGWDQLRHI